MKNCPYCGGEAVIDYNKIDYGRGYFGRNYFVKCFVCESKTKSVNLCDVNFYPQYEVDEVVSKVTKLWEDGKVKRNSKELDVKIPKKEYLRLLKIEQQFKLLNED